MACHFIPSDAAATCRQRNAEQLAALIQRMSQWRFVVLEALLLGTQYVGSLRTDVAMHGHAP